MLSQTSLSSDGSGWLFSISVWSSVNTNNNKFYIFFCWQYPSSRQCSNWSSWRLISLSSHSCCFSWMSSSIILLLSQQVSCKNFNCLKLFKIRKCSRSSFSAFKPSNFECLYFGINFQLNFCIMVYSTDYNCWYWNPIFSIIIPAPNRFLLSVQLFPVLQSFLCDYDLDVAAANIRQ